MYRYEFTTQHPPRMNDIKGPPNEIPPSDLEKHIGTATWTKEYPPGGFLEFGPIRAIFTLKRRQIWVLTDVPHHFSQDKTIKVTSVFGYTRTEMRSFSNTLETSTGIKVFGLGIGIKNTLELKEETIQQWREEYTTESTAVFREKSWYASWSLHDTLTVNKVVYYKDDFFPPMQVNDHFKVIISIYDDVVADKDIESRRDRAVHIIFPQGMASVTRE